MNFTTIETLTHFVSTNFSNYQEILVLIADDGSRVVWKLVLSQKFEIEFVTDGV